jgi:hypothetical protein
MQGTVSAGSTGLFFNGDQGTTSYVNFDGQPVTIALEIGGPLDALYVKNFSVQWSDQTYADPYVTSWEGTTILKYPLCDVDGNCVTNVRDPSCLTYDIDGFCSFVTYGPTGGSIRVNSSLGYGAGNHYFHLNYDFAFDQSQDTGHPIFGAPVTGGGTISAWQYTSFLDYTNADLNFTLSSLTQTGSVPEPATWALLIGGFAAVGFSLRRRRAAA